MVKRNVLMAGCFLLMASICAAEDRAPQARSLYQQESYEEVIELLGKSDAAGTLTAQEAYYLGLSQKQAGQPDAAIANLRKALNPPNPAKEAVVDLLYLLNNAEQDTEVVRWIQWAEKEAVAPAEISYLKGLLFARQGNTAEALRSFSNAKKIDPALSQRSDMQLAMLHVKDMNLASAKASLEAVITSDPSSELAGFARDYAAKVESSIKNMQKWSLNAGVFFQFDDNVVAKPSKKPQAVILPKQDDNGVNETFQISYNSRGAGPWQFNAQYSLYNNNNSRLHEYDQFSNTLSVIPSYMTEPVILSRKTPIVFSLPVILNYTHLDYKGYSDQVSVKPTATIVFNPEHFGQISAGYARRDMLNTITSQPSANRDANIFSGLLGYYYLFAKNKGMFNVRYEFIYEGTEGNDWRNDGNRLAADLLLPVTKSTDLVLSGDATWKFYLNSKVNKDEYRRDYVYIAGATIRQKLLDNIFLNLQYSHQTTSSNVAAYDYSRNVFLAGFEIRL